MDSLTASYQRLAILMALKEDPDHLLSDQLLQRMLKMLGFAAPLDGVRDHMSWLARRTLVSNRQFDDMQIARLTQRGEDVAGGMQRVEGVAASLPE